MKQSLVKLVLLGLLSLFVANAMAADGPPLTAVLPDLPADQEMLILEINLEPGQGSPPHRHNAHVFVYVLEGTVNMQVAGQEMKTLSAGEMFYENPYFQCRLSIGTQQIEIFKNCQSPIASHLDYPVFI